MQFNFYNTFIQEVFTYYFLHQAFQVANLIKEYTDVVLSPQEEKAPPPPPHNANQTGNNLGIVPNSTY